MANNTSVLRGRLAAGFIVWMAFQGVAYAQQVTWGEAPLPAPVLRGDTALTDSFQGVRSSKPVDLAIMPIGAYDPWISVHCNPEQAWRMGVDCGAEHLLPVHHQTFRLSREPYLEPVERFVAAAGSHPERVIETRGGDEWSVN